MKRYLFDKFNLFTLISIIILYFSLLIGFYYNENSTGGAYGDYYSHKEISKTFADNFLNTLLNFDKTHTRHSPVLLILFSFFEKFEISDYVIRLINLHICLFLPFIFYKCLKKKFINVNNNYLVLLSCLIFLSPTFRSTAIWPDSRVWGLIFICLSIYYFLIYNSTKKIKHCYLVILFYTVSSYISPNFSVYSIFFMLFFFKDFKINKNLELIILNLLLAFPALYYIFILDNNFMFAATAVPGGSNEPFSINDISNKFLIISSIVIFYLIPFLISKSVKIPIQNLNAKKLIIILILFCISIFFFNYKLNYTGGGIFFKISNIFFGNNFVFLIIAVLSLILNFLIFSHSKNNYLIIFIIALSNPQITIYHKYYDPFLLILFLTLFNLNLEKKKLFSKKSIFIFYLFSLFFLSLSIFKSYV
mgnify:CR=1 FL=1|tara:strand:+ start:31 stop:1287 length:1257 start_codon:yes stop_codon:yes gene_type:complete